MIDIINRKPSYNSQLTLEDLKSRNTEISRISLKNKKDVKIAVIDDNGFDIDKLSRLGFKDVRLFDRFNEVFDFEVYDIILCDINGIGTDIDNEYQGAAIAGIIKKAYPDKIVIVYSAENQTPNLMNYIKNSLVDDFISKNIQKSALDTILTDNIKKINDPIKIWERMRIRLIENNIAPKTIGLMEHYYVKSFINNKDYSKKIIQLKESIPNDLVSNIVSIISGIIQLYLAKRLK